MLAADGGSLLRPGYIDKALEVEEYLQYKLKGKFLESYLMLFVCFKLTYRHFIF